MTTIVAGAPTNGCRLWVQWTLADRGRPRLVSFAGEIDVANTDVLLDTLGTVLEACAGRLIIDLTAVEFADAGGACALLKARRMAAARSVRLDVVCSGRTPRRLLTVAGEDEEVEFFATVADALRDQSTTAP